MDEVVSPLRVGLIGLGRMGQRHLRVLSMLKGVDLRFAFDTDVDAARQLTATAGVQLADDLEHSLHEVDAVVIATPTTTHEHYIRLAAPHVANMFVEKPLTDGLESAVAMRQFARDHGFNIQVGLIERFNPAVAQMKTLLDQSRQVVNVDFVRTAKLSARITDVDVVTDLMIHDIDLALYLNGPVSSVSAYGVASGDMIDFACASLVHQNGRFSRIQASRITDKKVRVIQATCKDMFIECELLRKEITLNREAEFIQPDGALYRITSTSETLEVPPQEALLTELQAFVSSCKGGAWSSVPGVEESVAAMEICAEVQRAVYGKR